MRSCSSLRSDKPWQNVSTRDPRSAVWLAICLQVFMGCGSLFFFQLPPFLSNLLSNLLSNSICLSNRTSPFFELWLYFFGLLLLLLLISILPSTSIPQRTPRFLPSPDSLDSLDSLDTRSSFSRNLYDLFWPCTQQTTE